LQKIVYIGNKLSGHGFTPTTIDTLTPSLKQLGYEVVTASEKQGKLQRLTDMVGTILRHKDADAVLIDTYSTSAFYFAYICARLCKWLGLKYIPILHGGNLPARFQQSPRLVQTIFSNSFTNVAVSPYLLQLLKDYGYKHTLIENSIELDNYPFRLRTQANPNIMWVRAFDKIYAPDMAIRVFRNVKELYEGATLTMVGPDKDGSMAKCKALAEDLELKQSVRFTGKLNKPDWIKIANEADVFLNTSMFDNLPVSILEAMALGMVIVSTNAGGIPYFINDGQQALLNNVNDIEAMTDNVLNVLAGSANVAMLSSNARKAAENYDWVKVKSKWVSLFDNLPGK